jgi:hypothetical protein
VIIQGLDLNKRATVEEKCADQAFLVRMCDAEREEIKHLKSMASFPPSVIAHN